MAANPTPLNPSNPILLFPFPTSGNEMLIRLGNRERRVHRSSGIGATILFKTREEAERIYVRIQQTELCMFGRSYSKMDREAGATDCFVDIHGNPEEVLPAIQRVFRGSIIYGQIVP